MTFIEHTSYNPLRTITKSHLKRLCRQGAVKICGIRVSDPDNLKELMDAIPEIGDNPNFRPDIKSGFVLLEIGKKFKRYIEIRFE